MSFTLSSARLLNAYRWFFSAVILFSSAQTLIAVESADRHTSLHALLFGSIESIAAFLFLFRRLQVVTCAILVVLFATAFMVSLGADAYASRFLLYAATPTFIVLIDRAGHSASN
jgi:hypothetical protein